MRMVSWGAGRALLAAWMLLTVLFGAACGDEGLARREEGEMVVRAGGSGDALFVLFPPVGRASNADSSPAIEVENGGTADVTVTSIEVITDETGYITPKTTLNATPFTIAPEAQLRILFRLAIPSDINAEPLRCPEPIGALPDGINPEQYCGQITFRTNARQGKQAITVYLLSSQRGGQIGVTPSVLTFPSPQIGREQSQSFTIMNEGSGPLKIEEIFKSDFPSGVDEQFRLDGFPLPQTLEGGEAVVYTVAFTPQQTDAVEGRIQIRSDDASLPMATVTVRTGAGDAAQIQVDPMALNFPLGAESKNVTVSNTGTGAALLINSLTIEPRDAAASYTIGTADGDTCAPLAANFMDTIARQQAKIYCVQYTPGGARTSARLVISSNAVNVNNGRVEVALTAGEAQPDGRLEPANMIFDAGLGETVSREFAILNEGQAPLNLTGYTLQGSLDPMEISVSPDPDGVSIAPGGIEAFTLTYARRADDVGLDQGALLFQSNNPVELSFNVRNNIQADAFAPVAALTQSPDNPVAAGVAVTLDGSGSTSMSGEIEFYTWLLLERPNGSEAALPAVDAEADNITFTPDVAGRYRVQLTVTSSLQLEGAAVREITVE